MIRMTRTQIAAISGALVLLLGGNVLPGHRAAAQTVTVQIVNQGNTWAFSPLQITVLAGTTITWQNVSSAPHTATSDPGSPAAFDTGTIPAGGQASVTLTVPGTYTYFCAIHPPPLMARGSIVVMTAGPTATPPSGPPPPPTRAPTATPTATSTPLPPTATPTPALTLKITLSPKRVKPGQKLHVKAKTLPSAALTVKVSYKGAKTVTRHSHANGSGSYSTTLTVSRKAQRGKLKVQITATLGGRRLQKSAQATIP